LDRAITRFVLGWGKAAVTDQATAAVGNLDIRRTIGRAPVAAAGPASGAVRPAEADSCPP
jgi:hypothetical protein